MVGKIYCLNYHRQLNKVPDGIQLFASFFSAFLVFFYQIHGDKEIGKSWCCWSDPQSRSPNGHSTEPNDPKEQIKLNQTFTEI